MRRILSLPLFLLSGLACRQPEALPPGAQRDPKDGGPNLLGEVSPEAILSHRPAFRDGAAKALLSEETRKRWAGVQTPCLLVAAFGSWCGDSQRQLPELLALQAQPNPFIQVRYLGAGRDKRIPAGAWPAGLEAQVLERVPTFWLFVQQPGGSWKLAGRIVETPPLPGQRMAEALVELATRAE